MRRFGDAVFPRRMGSDYRWLVTSSWATNLGDEIALAAGPRRAMTDPSTVET